MHTVPIIKIQTNLIWPGIMHGCHASQLLTLTAQQRFDGDPKRAQPCNLKLNLYYFNDLTAAEMAVKSMHGSLVIVKLIFYDF